MGKRKNVFFDTKLNEWMFNILVNLPGIQKENLNHYEMRFIRSRSAIKAFVNNENLEKKLTFLSKIGMKWSLIFFKDSKLTANEVKQVYRQYAIKGKSLESIERIISHETFVLDSRDISIALSLMSLNCHSEAYILNPGFLALKKTSRAVKNANISMKELFALKNANVEHNEVSRETRNLSKLLVEANKLDTYLAAHLSLQMLDMMILWVLYQTPHQYVSVDYLKRELADRYKPASVGMRCAFLFRERRMIDKRNSASAVAEYIILQEGAITVGKVNNFIIDKVYR